MTAPAGLVDTVGDQSGPDLNQLLDSVSDLNRMTGRIPKVFRRRSREGTPGS